MTDVRQAQSWQSGLRVVGRRHGSSGPRRAAPRQPTTTMRFRHPRRMPSPAHRSCAARRPAPSFQHPSPPGPVPQLTGHAPKGGQHLPQVAVCDKHCGQGRGRCCCRLSSVSAVGREVPVRGAAAGRARGAHGCSRRPAPCTPCPALPLAPPGRRAHRVWRAAGQRRPTRRASAGQCGVQAARARSSAGEGPGDTRLHPMQQTQDQDPRPKTAAFAHLDQHVVRARLACRGRV